MNNDLLTIAKKFQDKWKKLYIVWGFCREKFLEISKLSTDIDLATDALPDEVENIVHCVGHIGKKYGTQIIYENKQSYEVTTFRSDIGILNHRKPVEVKFTTQLDLDAQRRDFSCNAIYYDIIHDVFKDPVGGVDDIKEKKLRFIGLPEARIQEDALRILRAIRIKNKYNFSFADKNYYQILEKNIWLLKNISSERIKQELDKILLHSSNISALKDLKKIWFFKTFFPELEKQSQTPWNSHHLEWDVWTHTLMTLEYLNGMDMNEKAQNEVLDYYWTLLFHDVTKPMCFSIDSQWEWHYYGHEKSGAHYFLNEICSTLPFSKNSQKKIAWLIENHLRIFKIFEMKIGKSRSLMMHPYFLDLMIIWEADHMGRIPTNYQLIEKLQSFYNNFQEILKTKTFLTWKDILQQYPELTGKKIWEKLNQLNYEILINDKK